MNMIPENIFGQLYVQNATNEFQGPFGKENLKKFLKEYADPESKGKIEHVVKFTKQNFLYNRPFQDVDTLNMEALAWLGRTANGMVHGITKKVPGDEWNIEKPFLIPCLEYALPPVKPETCTVRKDNTIYWKSNLYSVPLGTYKGRGSQVTMKLSEGYIIVSNLQSLEICRHLVASGTGKKIKNNDHKRDKSTAINALIDQLSQLLDNPLQVKQFLNAIRKEKPRYVRDQVLVFKQVIENTEKTIVQRALDYCCDNQVLSANDFKAVAEQFKRDEFSFHQQASKIVYMNLLGKLPAVALTEPATSSIEDYETILKIKP
jgi:hypothetical protein